MNFVYLLLILIVIVLIMQNQQHGGGFVQRGGGGGRSNNTLSPSEVYAPILPSGSCNKSSNTPGLAYSSLYASDLGRSLDSPGRTQDEFYSSKLNPAQFNPPCLTKKPYGNAMATYQYWKHLPALLRRQYADCDKYKCATETLNGYEALPRLERCIQTQAGKVEPSPTLACDVVNQDYYNSPADFCRAHPEHYPCPNWWMNNPEQVNDVTLNPGLKPLPKNIPVRPQVSMTKNNLGFCLSSDPSCKINDGQGMLMIKRHREDQGLC